MAVAKSKLGTGTVIPQEMYSTPRPHIAFASVTFYENGSPGVRLRNALNNDLQGLQDPNAVPTLTTTAQKITLRISWPGYMSWSDVMHVYNHAYESKPATRQKLAHNLAKKIKSCLDDLCHSNHSLTDQGADSRWRLSNTDFDRLILLELRHVSAGSWQPVLAFDSSSA